MPKTLTIVRHADAVNRYPEMRDRDRMLSVAGVKAAYRMAYACQQVAEQPQLVLCSPAARAMHTAAIYLQEMSIPLERLRLVDRIYASSLRVLLDVVGDIDPQVERLMLFGHNPEFSQLVQYLCPQGPAQLPTGGTVTLSLRTEAWNDLQEGSGKLLSYLKP